MGKISQKPIKVVIFAGGVGTRMWPMSRQDFPKQFQPLVGGHSMFYQAVNRVKKGFKPEDIYVATEERHKHFVYKQAPSIPKKNVFGEPEKRDTAGAIALAAARINHHHPHAIMAAIWGADHIVEEEEVFIDAIKIAGTIAAREPVVVRIGAKATFPNIYDGWIETGKQLEKHNGIEVKEILKFKEKPDLATAKKYFRSIKYFINTGYLIADTNALLDLYKKHAPGIYKPIAKIKAAIGKPNFDKVLRSEYSRVEMNSVEYVISEKLSSKEIKAVVADMGWIDVGTWELLYAGLANTNKDNVIQAHAETIDTTGSVIYAKGKKLVATIGVSDLVIVDTDDALLVCDRNRSAEVKQLLIILSKKGEDKYH